MTNFLVMATYAGHGQLNKGIVERFVEERLVAHVDCIGWRRCGFEGIEEKGEGGS